MQTAITYPDLKILDKDQNLLAVIDSYSSFQGERRAWEVGSMELHLGLEDQGASTIQEGNLVMIDEKRVWEITGIKKTEGTTLTLEATGRELKGILAQRIVVPQEKDDEHFYGWDRFPAPLDPDVPAESIIKHYIGSHAITPTDAKRALPDWELAADQGRGPETRWSARFRALTDTLKDIGEQTGIGYTATLDLENKRFIVDIIPEKDQAAGSDHPVILGIDYDNIQTLDYRLDTEKDITIAYAGGAGEDEDRLIQAVARTPEESALSGYARREGWLECGSSQDIEDLVFEATYQLSQQEQTETLTASAAPYATFKYLEDWDLGSIVTVKSERLGITQDKKVTAVKEIYERGKIQIIPTLGKRNKTIIDEIRKTEVIR